MVMGMRSTGETPSTGVYSVSLIMNCFICQDTSFAETPHYYPPSTPYYDCRERNRHRKRNTFRLASSFKRTIKMLQCRNSSLSGQANSAIPHLLVLLASRILVGECTRLNLQYSASPHRPRYFTGAIPPNLYCNLSQQVLMAKSNLCQEQILRAGRKLSNSLLAAINLARFIIEFAVQHHGVVDQASRLYTLLSLDSLAGIPCFNSRPLAS